MDKGERLSYGQAFGVVARLSTDTRIRKQGLLQRLDYHCTHGVGLTAMTAGMVDIICVHSPAEIEEIRRLFREYESFLGVDLRFQNFEAELKNLPGRYAAPDGMLLLARRGRRSIGCGALRRFGAVNEQTCEMKRLYVRPQARGSGAGRALAERLIAEAARLSYARMVLDTLDHLQRAVRLYVSLGFVQTAPYYDNPLPGAVYWSLDLSGANGNPSKRRRTAFRTSEKGKGPILRH